MSSFDGVVLIIIIIIIIIIINGSFNEVRSSYYDGLTEKEVGEQ
jgi:hypothetical protein